MKKFLKNLLKQEHKGVLAIETTLLTPLMFTTCLMLLYFFFMGCAYVTYSNLANTIAMELNSRTTGAVYTATAPDIWTYSTLSNSSNGQGHYLQKNRMVFKNGTITSVGSSALGDIDGTLRPSAFYVLEKYKYGFAIPFNEVMGINITSSQRLRRTDDGRDHVGAVITVQINFRTTLFGDILSPTMHATGYGVIA